MTARNVWKKFGLPHGFDGPMHPFGMHTDTYNGNHYHPVHYGGTLMVCILKSMKLPICLPILKQCFHMACICLMKFLLCMWVITVECLYPSMCLILWPIWVTTICWNFGPSIMLWILDDCASSNCNWYIEFNNIIQTEENEELKKGFVTKFVMVCWCHFKEVHYDMGQLFVAIQLQVNYVLQVTYLVFILAYPCQLSCLAIGMNWSLHKRKEHFTEMIILLQTTTENQPNQALSVYGKEFKK